MNLFGKKKPKPKIQDSISQLRDTMITLEKREAHLQKQADEALQRAKEKSKKNDKRGALFELKRKKMFEKQIENMFGKRVNLETQIFALQNASANKEVLAAMKKGKEAIASHISEKDIDEAADIMDQIDEHVGLIDEIDQALSQPVGQALDDDELEAELNELEDLALQEEVLDEGLRVPVPKPVMADDSKEMELPKVPSSRPVGGISKEEEDELAALEAEIL